MESDSSGDEYLPLNNVVNWDEWNKTGTYLAPEKPKAKQQMLHKSNSSPKLKAKYSKKMAQNAINKGKIKTKSSKRKEEEN